MRRLLRVFLPSFIAFVSVNAQQFGNPNNLAPYVPSPQIVVDKMLEMAHLKPGELVYDLGCGDGRIVITAAQKYKARAVGVELSLDIYKSTLARVKRLGLDDKVKILNQDLRRIDLRPADVVTLYLLTGANELIKPNLEKLKPGARVVSHDYEIRGWTAARIDSIEVDGVPRTIYVYEIKLNR